MLATSARVSPWSARTYRCSAPRPTTTLPSATFTEQSSWTRISSLPLGPLARPLSLDADLDALGIGIGFLPIRDIVSFLVSRATRSVPYHT